MGRVVPVVVLANAVVRGAPLALEAGAAVDALPLLDEREGEVPFDPFVAAGGVAEGAEELDVREGGAGLALDAEEGVDAGRAALEVCPVALGAAELVGPPDAVDRGAMAEGTAVLAMAGRDEVDGAMGLPWAGVAETLEGVDTLAVVVEAAAGREAWDEARGVDFMEVPSF